MASSAILAAINILAPIAAKEIAALAAERGVSPEQIITDSNALDDATMARAIAFAAQGHLDGTKPIT